MGYDSCQQLEDVRTVSQIGAPGELLAGRSLFLERFLGVMVLRRGSLPLCLQPTGHATMCARRLWLDSLSC
jgi:hypothetical protein